MPAAERQPCGKHRGTESQAYGHEDIGAASMLVATVASFFTLSGLLWVFANHPAAF